MEAVAFNDSHQDFAMVDFYAADCGHCQQFAPVWEKAATGSSLPIRWETKECFGPAWSHGKDFEFCKDMNVSSFPTVKLVHFDQHGHATNAWDYNGTRSAQALEDFASERLHAVADVVEQTLSPLLGFLASWINHFSNSCTPKSSLADFL